MEPLFFASQRELRSTSKAKHERNGMEHEEKNIAERLEGAATLLEKALNWIEEQQVVLSGELEKISATVEQGRHEAELCEKLAAAEREFADYMENLRHARDREEFERFMNARRDRQSH